jgi:histidine phosphotransferase ChpT
LTVNIELTSLIGSRICHDLISPLGAIGNGVELLAMSEVAKGPEMSLIAESVENANARIRFFRVAFGAASKGQKLGRAEVLDLLSRLTRAGRLSIQWKVDGDTDRGETKLAFLCLQCLEATMPWGGRITVTARDGTWSLVAEAPRLRELTDLWAAFDSGVAHPGLAAAEVEFVLAPVWACEAGYRLTREAAPGRIALNFAPA